MGHPLATTLLKPVTSSSRDPFADLLRFDPETMHIVRREGGITLASIVASNPAKAAEAQRDLLVVS